MPHATKVLGHDALLTRDYKDARYLSPLSNYFRFNMRC